MPEGWQMMPWYGMIFGPIMMIVVLATVVTVVVLVVRWIGAPPHWAPPQDFRQAHKTPLQILEERFAKGEIEKDDFEERRKLLS